MDEEYSFPKGGMPDKHRDGVSTPDESALRVKLLNGLHSLLQRKPSATASPSTLDEFNLKLQEIYFELITCFPQFAISHKLELEMWNTLYKTPIDTLQKALHNSRVSSTGIVTFNGQQRSLMELKLRFILLLDRVAGVYLSLIYRLVNSLPASSWPTVLLNSVTSSATPLSFFNFNQLGTGSGRFDLDLVTFNALPNSFTHFPGGGNTRMLDHVLELNDAAAAAPRILSRGERLPAEQDAGGGGDEKQDASYMADLVEPVTCMLDEESAVSYIVQHCLVHLGDVARYRQQFNVAAGYYLWASMVHPESGHAYNQLAIIESSKGSQKRSDTCLYLYVRAVSCADPFPAAHTNMKGLLKTHLTTKLVQQSPWTSGDLRELLIQLYAQLHLESDTTRLIDLATAFASAATQSDRFFVGEDSSWLTRMVSVHFHFLTEHLKTEESPATHSEQCDVGHAVLLFVTVHWIELLLRQCPSTLPRNEAFHNLLSPLTLVVLWLRLQCVENVSAPLNAALRIYCPPLSLEAVNVLNDLCSSTGKAPSSLPPDPTPNWSSLVRLPEIARLQAFQPLSVPTLRKIGPTNVADLFHQFIIDRQRFSAADLTDDRFTSAADVSGERVDFIVESFRLLAHHLPALVGWCATNNQSGSLTPQGPFRQVSRTVPKLCELILPKTSKPEPESEIKFPTNGASVSDDGRVADSPKENGVSAEKPLAPPTTHASATVSASVAGGLIVNAELAKFIQEQASQVAARQQRAELSTSNLRDMDNGSGVTQKLEDLPTKPYASRLYLSPGFRRDLPPRFARRLQAEMLEHETGDANQHNGTDVLNLNQPAPLARKESEAPFELNSLLAVTDGLHPHEPIPNGIPYLHSALSSPSLLRTTVGDCSNGVGINQLPTPYQNSSLYVSHGPPISTCTNLLSSFNSDHLKASQHYTTAHPFGLSGHNFYPGISARYPMPFSNGVDHHVEYHHPGDMLADRSAMISSHSFSNLSCVSNEHTMAVSPCYVPVTPNDLDLKSSNGVRNGTFDGSTLYTSVP